MRPRPILAALLATAVLLVPAPVDAGELEVEPNHTTVGFSIPIAGGLTRVTGKFTEFEISLAYEGDEVLADPGSWRLEAAIATASIDTGIDSRDEHLRQPDFFDAETFPRITFTSRRIERRGDGYVAIGDFSIHGVEKPLELPFTVTGTIGDDVTGVSMIGAAARTTIKRSDYGVARDFRHTHMKDFLGDEVTIEIFCWLRPPKPAPPDAAED